MGRPKKSTESAPAQAAPVSTATAVAVQNGSPAFRGVQTVEAVPQSAGLEGTTTHLFPDAAEVVEEPQTTEVIEPQEPATQAPPAATPPADDFNIDEFFEKNADKKVRLKVDGVEEELTLAEVKRNVQLNRHLGKVGQQIGEARKKLAEETRKIEEMRSELLRHGGQVDAEGQPQAPAIDRSTDKITALEAKIESLESSLAPVRQQSLREQVAERCKTMGHPEYMEYIPKMDIHMAELWASNPDLATFYDTPAGSIELFLDLKTKEVEKRLKSPPAPTEPKQEKVDKKTPPIVKIDGGAPSSTGIVDDAQAKYAETWKAWKEETNSYAKQELFSKLLRMKGIK